MARLTLRMPDALHRQLKAAAAQEGVSLNQYMTYLLTREMMLDEALVRAIQEGESSQEVSHEEVKRMLAGEEVEGQDASWRQRLVMDPDILSGKPVVRSTRLPVAAILNQLGHGATPEELLAEYEGLSAEDIRACLLLAAAVLS